jgi:photosystem II stability/assembly factor-like uncharacterized protein
VFCVTAASGFQDVLDTPAHKSPIVGKHLYNGIALAGKRLVAVGQYGYILYSDDQGKSWNQANVPVSCDLLAVHFPTPEKGWAVGHDGIVLHTSDAGVNWIKQLDGREAPKIMSDYYAQNLPKGLSEDDLDRFKSDIQQFVDEGADKPFLCVFFENETTGFIGGAFNMIFRTGDGGKSWEPWFDRVDNPGLLHQYSINFIDGDIYMTGEQGMVWKLDRQAMRFKNVRTPYDGTLFGITGNKGTIIAFGMRGNVYRSTDKATNWTKIETGLPMGITGGTVNEDGRILLVSQAGNVLAGKGDNSGFFMVPGPIFPSAAIASPERNTVVLAGFAGLLPQKLTLKEAGE